MIAIEWSLQTIVLLTLLSLLCIALGYLSAMLRMGRQTAQLSANLEQIQAEKDSAVEQIAGLKARVESALNHSHQQDILLSKAEQQQVNAQQTEQRLTAELAQSKEQYQLLSEQYRESEQQKHQVEKQNEIALSERRALSHQEQELRARLQQAELADERNREMALALRDRLAEEGKKTRSAESSEKEARSLIGDLKHQLTQTELKFAELQEKYSVLLSEHAKLNAAQQEREASHRRELANFETQKLSFVEQFKVLSNEILDVKTQALQENSKNSLSALMNPFQQSMESFKKEIQEIHHRETMQQGELRKELETLKDLNKKITSEAHELSTALRGQKKLQGNWGEMILENVLESSGLQINKDYKREVSINTEEGRQRPDAIVYLPQGKHLIIDAKVSLNAYTRFVNAEDELTRRQALKEHVHAVSSRIKELAERNYAKLPGLNSPEIVFMFIPIESAFVEALKGDESLFQQAIGQNILVATPTTLLTSLNIVRQLWRYEDQNKHTAALASKAESVFKKFNGFLASFEKVKKGLDSANAAYIQAEGQLVSGKGNLIKQVGEFKNLAPAIKAELPSYFADKAALEIDFIAPEPASEHLDK